MLFRSLGSIVETNVVCLEKIVPDVRIRQHLRLAQDEKVWMLQRVRKVDHEAIILDTDFLNAAIVPDLTKEIAEDSLYAYIEGVLGLRIAYADKEITCQRVNGLDERLLDMHGYDMVVNVESDTYLDDARIFQFTSSHHRPDKFRFKDFARRIKTV